MNRRDVVKALFGGAGEVATWPQQRKPWHPRQRHQNEILYHGPLLIPVDVERACRENPDVRSRTGSLNPKKLIMCYTDAEDRKWRFRCPIPENGAMVGQIQRGTDGIIRFVFFAAAGSPQALHEAREVLRRKLRTPEQAQAEIEARKAEQAAIAAPAPLLPPLNLSEASDEVPAYDYSEYIDPAWSAEK